MFGRKDNKPVEEVVSADLGKGNTQLPANDANAIDKDFDEVIKNNLPQEEHSAQPVKIVDEAAQEIALAQSEPLEDEISEEEKAILEETAKRSAGKTKEAMELMAERMGLSKNLDEFGPLRELMMDSSISDILINDAESVYVEVAGILKKTDVKFESEEQLYNIAKIVAESVGRVLDPERPYVDARMPDGSRVNIIAPPLALDGVSMSIRKFPDQILLLEGLVKKGTMTQDIADFLKVCAASKVNTLIVGGTGSGKTTLLNATAQNIGSEERIVTIEDAAELRLPIDHIVRLESKPFIHGKPQYHEVTIRDLVINALRMRPDRIIVGETRGPEAFDMVQAMNTGHDGSMTTIHANTPRDAIMRLENMINVAVPTMPSLSVKQRIASSIELIVMVSRMDDGSRKVTHVTEITGMEGDTVISQDLFKFKQDNNNVGDKVTGSFEKANIMPRFAAKCNKAGYSEEMKKIFNVSFG